MSVFRDKLRNAEHMASFEDVYIVPSRAKVEPYEVDLSTKFSRNVSLRVPISSAPMDTVSCAELAIALALHGAIGVLHRNCSTEEQLDMALKVKNAPLIPVKSLYAKLNDPCNRVIELMKSEELRELPIIDEVGKVIGYVYISDLLEACSSNCSIPIAKFVKPRESITILNSAEARKQILRGLRDAIAIVTKEGLYVGTVTIHEALDDVEPLVDEESRLRVAAAISPFDIERAKKLDKVVDVLVSDVAHFHNDNVLSASKKLVKEITHDFVAGNLGTYEAAIDTVSIVERVDGLRVGLGGGSICITPEVGGAYAPTLWAVANVRDALEEIGARDIPIIADGGIRTPGDAVKALAAGAHSVMLGFVFAGTEEACAPLISIGSALYKPYRGMASRGAMMKRFAMDRYSRVVKRVPEGIEGLVPYKGSAVSVLREFVEGLKAGFGYAGARNLEELWHIAKFGRTARKIAPRELKTSFTAT